MATGTAWKREMPWRDQDVEEAIRYVVERQGEPIEVFLRDVP
jgi:hypothetical protein